MDCSIIIVSWNAREFLANCLRSILGNPSRHSLEVIVVDNASNDGSPEVVRAQFPTVRLLEAGANLGFARANNVGIRSSTGKYICLINSDAAVIDDCLDRLFDRNGVATGIECRWDNSNFLCGKAQSMEQSLPGNWARFPVPDIGSIRWLPQTLLEAADRTY